MANRSFTVGCLAAPIVRVRLRSRDIEFECINNWPYNTFEFPSSMEYQLAKSVVDQMEVQVFDG